MFPLILLFVTVGSYFVERETVTETIIRFLGHYIPVAREEENLVVKNISGVLQARGEVSVLALAVLAWSAVKFLKVLIRAANRAWDSRI